ncbi:BREX-1 system adenine-specific DNA-methyltransferase PglX [Pseudomonas aeruginosa]|uniref:BREX-1 system adenine-specific DNA-methyltransferase PglX n=1 Tax=Pseudomonas aeruginosa TaxID=287 RepID=UPI000F53873B|nr:BREX-1 system adenine-specific DNA-methyltransferase PglX [Pseudomonas aeruginosa]RPV98695.1 SAM-dependent methyltransferase [Pseudomonas aeruginosa]WCW08886.1 BREX-1 system adenine-specific DNA-methyltransferase PglX [Pseudomonas aeruginosa]
MNTNNVKRYAPKARTAFIAAMTKRAALFGIRESSIPSMGIEPLEQKGDLALIGDRPFPASIIRPRAALVKKVEHMGFAQAMEQAAYSWFNRLCAIRYMELKGYFDHGRRVLSHPDHNGGFQILDDCLDIELEGLDRQHVAELKLEGTKDEELYRELLLAQCHALHKAMPFLFEAVDDATELLLPDNLTKTDSLIRELVEAIPEEDWQEVEIIGWLYQFYISEKKDQVIGKVVKSEDIPAATQLFTPNWIVQYLVQNSVGRQWLQTYPGSPLKARMQYYIEPTEQNSEVQAQLAAITPDSIDPLSIKVLDPACGSGHILVEAYKVLKEIYTERGFRSRDIPQLILENNLFGLDIDDRAGQLAGFALMMLAREDDRRIFGRMAENGFKLNVLSLQESNHLDFASQWKAINLTSDWQRGHSQSLFDNEQSDLSSAHADNRYQLLKTTLARFPQAKTFGSLIEVPAEDAEPLGELLEQLRQLARGGDVMQKPAAEQLIPFVQQAWVLAQRYDAVVANPPYMGSKFYNLSLKTFVNQHFENAKGDLYAAFIERNLRLAARDRYVGMITIPNWMFLSSFEGVRREILSSSFIETFVHNGRGVWGSDFGSCSFVIRKSPLSEVEGKYKRLFKKQGSVATNDELIERFNCYPEYHAAPGDFKVIPGNPIAYWIAKESISAFKGKKLSDIGITRRGLQTGDKDRYIRVWHECDCKRIELQRLAKDEVAESSRKWFLFNNGGDFRKWYGNLDLVVEWEANGLALKSFEGAIIPSESLYFMPGVCWPRLGVGQAGFRLHPEGFIPGDLSPCFYSDDGIFSVMAYLNSKVSHYYLNAINPTVTMPVGDMAKIPFVEVEYIRKAEKNSERLVSIHRADWDESEVSFDFSRLPLMQSGSNAHSLSDAYSKLRISQRQLVQEVRILEEENNGIFINGYALNNTLQPEVSVDEVTLTSNPRYRYGGNLDEELEARFQSDSLAELISYSVGCIMGRYSLDREGLVYAHAGNQGFAELVAEGAYRTFPADSDGILPLNDQEWFADDATNRFREFVRIVWGGEHLQENLDFVAESLCLYAIKPKRGESAPDTIRRYLSTQFFKDHLKTYKKRPIYWLFSSGKHKAFECLVYLHRYNEGTLARMRTEYVIPLTAKLNTYANKLEQDIEASTSTAEKKALEKQLATLHNQQAELATFDEKLRHYADQRINLDLDDGVKVNYGKFGDLLAEVKTVTGGKEES